MNMMNRLMMMSAVALAAVGGRSAAMDVTVGLY